MPTGVRLQNKGTCQAHHAYNAEKRKGINIMERAFGDIATMFTVIFIVIKEVARLWIDPRAKFSSCIMPR
jgi:hypothetical protein